MPVSARCVAVFVALAGAPVAAGQPVPAAPQTTGHGDVAAGGPLNGTETIRVDQPGRAARVVWSLDGALLKAGGTSLDLAAMGLPYGAHTVTVTVTDAARDATGWSTLVTRTRSWAVVVRPAGDLDLDFDVDTDDLQRLVAQWGPCDCPGGSSGDLDGNCVVDVDDLLMLLDGWTWEP